MAKIVRAWPVIFLFILLAIDIPMAMAIDEVVDDYENENRVDVKDGVVRNSTLDCMELNYTIEGDNEFENLTAYDKFDIGGRITHNGDYNVTLDFIRNIDTRLYEDYGVGFFYSFEWEYEMYLQSLLAYNCKIWFMLSNYTTNAKTQLDNHRRYLAIVMTRYPVGQVVDVIEGKSNGAQNFLTSADLNINTWYYNKFKLNATYWELSIFSDSARTVLVERLSVSLAETQANYRYLLISSLNTGGVERMIGRIRHIWLGNSTSGYETEGYFKTTNFLDGLSYNATVLLTNTSIPSGSINAEISNDGSSWMDLGALASGYGAIDLRALGFINSTLMFNFTKGNPNETPRLCQVRLVHEGDGAPPPVDDYSIMFLAIGLILMLCVAFLYVKNR